MAEWREIFEAPIIEEKREKYRIERRPWDGGVEVSVTRTKDGAHWGRGVSELEYRDWKRVDDYLKATGGSPHDRVLAAVGVLGGVPSTFVAGLLGWKRSYSSRILSEVKRRGLIEELPPRRLTFVRIPEIKEML